MLIIQRKIGESFRIGEAVVRILAIQGGRVKVGVQAPPAIRIMRSELEPDVIELPPQPPLRRLRLVGAA